MKYIVGNHYPSNKKEMSKQSAKKSLLKKIIAGKTKKAKGPSPFSLDNGLGKKQLAVSDVGSGSGSNLGSNGIF